ncbi:MAG: replication initiation protein [Cetobacterium sp.]
MTKSVVKYDNDMNTVAFGKFKEKELDLFFSICFKIRDTGTREIILQFDELKKLSNYSNRNLERFIKDLSTTYDKMLSLNITIRHSKLSFTKFNLFSQYTVNGEEKTIMIQVHDKFEYILNKIMGNYTRFDLLEFISLKSAYSKNIFKLLKQWETKKEKTFEIIEFRELLGIPIKYQMCNIDTKVLKPIMQELPQYFPNLKLKKIKTGRSVTSLKFTWSVKTESKKINDVIDIIEISNNLNKTIEKVTKNRFIKPLLTIDNVEILVQMFEEKDLVKGLNWSYKEIKQEIKSLNYLIKSIKTGIEQKEKKLVVKPVLEVVQLEKPRVEIQKIKIKITISEYEELYQKFLKAAGEEHNLLTRKGFDIANKNKYEITDDVKEITNEFELLYQNFISLNNLIDDENTRNIFSLLNPEKHKTEEHLEKIISISDIQEEKLLSKKGKKLVGGALLSRLEKIARDENIKIQYKEKIIE